MYQKDHIESSAPIWPVEPVSYLRENIAKFCDTRQLLESISSMQAGESVIFIGFYSRDFYENEKDHFTSLV